MNIEIKQEKDSLFAIGIWSILISGTLFALPVVFTLKPDMYMGIFMANFLITAFYFVMLWSSGKLRKGRGGLYPFFLFLILFLISAYSLNREMIVFEKSVTWFSVLLIIICVNYAAIKFFSTFPAWLKNISCFILGVAIVAFTYLALYLVPLYALSAIAFFALGISLHTFVPLLFTIYNVVLIRRIAQNSQRYLISILSGTAVSLIVITVYTLQWCSITNTIDKQYRKALLNEDNNLPGWVNVAQHVQHGYITERILKSELVYSVPNLADGNWFWSMPSRNFAEERKHDPLVMIAALFFYPPKILQTEKIKILESMYDSRRQAEERLWQGDDLITDHINTTVKIWPHQHLAYTEKAITVYNKMRKQRWPNQQEAIYTFHLPQGSVITSLSLWINGKEENAILTTKEKADSAYKTIVGVESRDPSVVHWQEGNRASVRVFPVVNSEQRLFKIGITTPLSNNNGRLVYNNIYFDGPDCRNTKEDIDVLFVGTPLEVKMPSAIESVNSKRYTGSDLSMKKDWAVSLKANEAQPSNFSFDNSTYKLQEYHEVLQNINLKKVYLDINKSWSREDYNLVRTSLKNKEVFACGDVPIQITDQNKDEIFTSFTKKTFSLFPFFLIADAEASLVITKNNALSPNIGDINNSGFSDSLKKYLAKQKAINVFEFGDELSPYLKTLREYRALNYDKGNTDKLKKLIEANTFVKNAEDSSTIVLHDAHLVLTKSTGTETSNAPDHLMRLFSYNHIMQQLGIRQLTSSDVNTDLVEEARKAYVVSPLSSLVVLETKEDYERFDIKNSQNSLQNASMKSTGAVPEPHDWALIFIAGLLIIYVRMGHSKTRLV